MSIYVTIEDKEGESFSEIIEILKIQRHFPAITDSCCLRFINDKEDTVFNKTQIAVLLDELVALKEKPIKQEEQEELEKITRLCNRAHKNQQDLYFKFYAENSSEG